MELQSNRRGWPRRVPLLLPLAIAILTLAFAACGTEESPTESAGGQLPAAPEFNLPRAGGGTVSLDQLTAAGEVVVVFYRGFF